MSDVANKVPSSWLDRLKARKFFLSLAGGAILFSIIQFRSSKRNPETRPQASNSDKKKKKDRNRKWLIRILLLIFAKKRVIVTFVSLAALLICMVTLQFPNANSPFHSSESDHQHENSRHVGRRSFIGCILQVYRSHAAHAQVCIAFNPGCCHQQFH